MQTLVPRGLDDKLIDKIVDILSSFSTSQSAIDPSVAFSVQRDRIRPVAYKNFPFINVWLETLDTQKSSSSGKLYQTEIARIAVDCYASALDEDSEDSEEIGSMARLYYLKEQAKYAIYSLINSDFGFDVGNIGKKNWPSWRLFQTPALFPEADVTAGRWSFEVEYSFIPQDIETIEFKEIFVDSNRWSALYEYNI
jgi:hypothetical protein